MVAIGTGARRARRVTARSGTRHSAFVGLGSTTFSVGAAGSDEYVTSIVWTSTYDAKGRKIKIPVLTYSSGRKRVLAHYSSGRVVPRSRTRSPWLKDTLIGATSIFVGYAISGLAEAAVFSIVQRIPRIPYVTGVRGKAVSVGLIGATASAGAAALSLSLQKGRASWHWPIALASAAYFGATAAYGWWERSPLSVDPKGFFGWGAPRRFLRRVGQRWSSSLR